MTPPVTNAMWSKNTLQCEKEIFFSRQEFHGYNRRPDPAGVEMERRKRAEEDSLLVLKWRCASPEGPGDRRRNGGM